MFRDRTEAGEKLADALTGRGFSDPVVYALPRGGVPVAAPVSRRLDAPLDLLLVRKIGMPGNPEFAAGAVVEGADPVFNDAALRMLGRSPEDFETAVAEKRAEIAVRRTCYLGDRPPEPVEGRTAIVVDDGIAMGATMRAALKGLASRKPARVVLAVPVAPADTLADLRDLVDEVVCLQTPEPFYAVGQHYVAFPQTSDAEVTAILRASAAEGKDGT